MRRILINLSLIFSLFMPAIVPAIVPGVALAACPSDSSSGGQVLSGIGETNCDKASGVGNVIGEVVSLLSYFVGILSIIVIIIAGVKYITSGGDSNKITNAKSTLLYALIGLAIAALAQLLVHFVLFQANQATK